MREAKHQDPCASFSCRATAMGGGGGRLVVCHFLCGRRNGRDWTKNRGEHTGSTCAQCCVSVVFSAQCVFPLCLEKTVEETINHRHLRFAASSNEVCVGVECYRGVF